MNGDSTASRKHASDNEPQRDRPGPALAGQLTAIAGPRERYTGLDDDAVMVAAGRWDALESWAYARKLAAARELVRRRPGPGATRRLPGGTPSVWRQDLAAEIALELAVSGHASDQLAWLAVTLETRLPLTAAALDAGILNPSKAKLIAAETMVLDDDQAGQAEALIADRWAGQTWSRIRDMITRAVINIDPDGAVKRRERAERDDARIRFFREQAGTCGLAGYGLPADEALKANQAVARRARQYRAWGIDGTLEELRVRAFIDLLTDRDARKTQPRTAPGKARKPKAGTPHGDGQASRGRGGNDAGHGADADGRDGQASGQDDSGRDAAGRDQAAGPDQDAADDEAAGLDEAAWDSVLGDEPADDGDDQDQTAQDQSAQDKSASDKSGRDDDGQDEAAWDSLLDHVDDVDDMDGEVRDGQDVDGQDTDDDSEGDDGQDGDGDGQGDDEQDGDGEGEDGGNGNGGGGQGPSGPSGPSGPVAPAGADEGLAANVDLIVPLADLTRYAQRAGHAASLGAIDPGLARRLAGQAARNPRSSFRIILTGPDGRAAGFGQATPTRATRQPGAAPPPSPSPGQAGDPPDHPATPSARFTPAGTGPDGGYGTWTLEIGGTSYRVRLYPIPAGDQPCDHRFEAAGYQPGQVLRRLAEARDGECMYPGCARTARSSEFEHATPWPAGRSCSCNGGIDCHHHNLLKQDPRWSVTQHLDGSRTWTTPGGLSYTKHPKQYPD